MDWDAFEHDAGLVIPDQPLKPKRCWIGVLLHDRDPRQQLDELDFIWMIGHAKITVEKIWQTYEARQEISDFHLVARNGILDKELAIKDIIGVGCELVVFRAVCAAQPSPNPEATRSPLTPLRTPNGASTPVAITSSAATLTSHIKNEPQDKTPLQRRGSKAAPPALPLATRHSSVKAESPGMHMQGAMNSPVQSFGQDEQNGRIAEPLKPSTPVTSAVSTHPDLPLAAVQLTQSTSAQSNAAKSALQTGSGLNASIPPADRAACGVIFEPREQPPPEEHTQASPACPQCRHHKVRCEGHSSTCGVASNSYDVEGLYNRAIHQVFPQHALVASHLPHVSWPDAADGFGVLPALTPMQQYQPEIRLAPHHVSNSTAFVQPPREPYIPPVFHDEIEEPSQRFDPDNLFNCDPSSQGESQDETQPTDRAIREIIKKEDPAMLESGVVEALNVLEDFKQVFVRRAASSPDAQAWIEAIDKLTPQAKRTRTVVGVVGNTGAGKSSVINAMLDEERLVPTNCMRACTAVVTEMSWNDNNDPFARYRAEIEFITRADWEKEVDTLMKEFLTDKGTLSRDTSDQNSDAGIAWAKFHAVYPKIARDSLDGCTVASLMDEQGLSVLDTTKKINAAQPRRFYYELQKYVDSKEKVTKKDNDKDKEKQKKSFEMEYWPLIKVVKIYTRAPALSTGAVIVDLPGVHDSNAARAAVAQGYIKQCTGLWIVAPITRAVDDKAAKTLLGDSFKTQLKYDGGFSSVTFICSKTDDISITEAIDTLELDEEVDSLYEQERELKQEIEDTQRKMDELEETRKVYLLAQREYADEIETWEVLQEQLDEGKTVFAPASRPSKRKKVVSLKNSRKRRQGDDEDSDYNVSEDEEDDDEGVEAPQEPLTEESTKTKLKELRDSRKTARHEGLEIKSKMEELKPRIREAEAKLKGIKAEINRICISGRNEYSKRAIQQDFAAGIRELDQENAAEEDEDKFNPDEEIRDYDEVAQALPVFCVSSRAYQKMCGRLQKDDAVPGFNTPEETEMPQLQAHCKKLTEAGRIQSARAFLLSACQLLTTFTLWASNDGNGVQMTDGDKRKQHKYVEKRLGELEKGLESAVEACFKVLKRELNDQIFDKYPDLIQDAIAAAPETAQRWGVHRADGGLAWATYKAVVRRNGAYQSPSAGHRDFNSELVDPIIKKLATSWERAFQTRLPKAFETFISDSGKILHRFHESVEARARQTGVGLASLSTLKAQIHNYEMLFTDLNQTLIHQMTDLQREANRDFTPTIGSIMHTVYELCTDEHGPGSFKRMKAHMAAHVERARYNMFNEATLTVTRHLEHMCRKLKDVMEAKADEIFVGMKADYLRVLGGVSLSAEAVMPRDERDMRAEIKTLLGGVDARFEVIETGRVLSGEGGGGDDDKAEQQCVAEDEDETEAFESARESAREDASAGADEDLVMLDASIIDGVNGEL